MNEDDVYAELLTAVPEARSMLADHAQRWHDVHDAYLLMDDLLALALQWFGDGRDELLAGLLAFVERCLVEGDDLVRDAVTTDFVGYTPPWDPAMATFVRAWPEALRVAGVAETRRFTGGPGADPAR